MPRYIEQLNECTDPDSADWAWIVDNSAGATDKDKKLSLARLPILDSSGRDFRLGNHQIVTLVATNNYTATAAIGSPRLSMISLELTYDGATNAMESSAISLTGGALLARDCRILGVMSAHVSFGSSGQSRHTVYAPLALTSGGAYQTLTSASSAVLNTGYTYTTEIKGANDGTIQVKVTRTGGATTAANVHVSLIVAT